MSANIYWEPWEPKPKRLEVVSFSKAKNALNLVFGGKILTQDDVSTLEGMTAVNQEFSALLRALDENEMIRVWWET